MPKYLRGERVRIAVNGFTGEIQLPPSPGRPFYIVTVDTDQQGNRLDSVMVSDYDERELEPLNTPVDVLRYGMTPEQLGEGFTAFIKRAYRRIVTVGRAYDNGTSQQFEDMTPRAILVMALEEAEDLAVYAGMVHIRIQRMIAAMEAAEKNGGAL
jgi:hypothetical protein